MEERAASCAHQQPASHTGVVTPQPSAVLTALAGTAPSAATGENSVLLTPHVFCVPPGASD